MANSRPQKRLNQIWRRRSCTTCGAVFTTHESLDYSKGLVVQNDKNKITPFQREKLFLSIYRSCRHRKNSLEDAIGLTETVIGKITKLVTGGSISASILAQEAFETLQNFDQAGSVQYSAYHPEYSYSEET